MKDITQMNIKPAKSISIFEISNEGREYEYGRSSGKVYVKPFREFLETFGFEIKSTFGDDPKNESIKINGYDFTINTKNCSYISRNAFTRQKNIRKDVNRYIELKRFDSTILKIHFNKEYETEKIKEKVIKAIQAVKDREQAVIDMAAKLKMNTEKVAAHFLGEDLKTGEIFISKGFVTISFGIGHVIFNENIQFQKFCIDSITIKSDSDIELTFDTLNSVKVQAKKIIEAAAKKEQLPDELKEFIKSAYNERFKNGKYYTI